MTGADDLPETVVEVLIGDESLGTFPVVTDLRTTPDDLAGTASVNVTLPSDLEAGTTTLLVRGTDTGTEIPVEIQVDDGTTDVQVLAINDLHGRLHNNASGAEAGAAVLAGAVKQLRAANPNTVFAAAGDLIGASTFDSFILQDKPTIDALNEAGLEVAAVGNHELDKGYADLVDRVMAAESAENPRGGAEWEYIAANLTEPGGADNIASSWTKSFGEIEVGFVGAVTEDLLTLVQAEGNEGVDVTDVVTAVNAEAEELKTAGADIVVMLVHEGAPSTGCDLQAGSVWNDIVTGVGADVDAIVSGHTHFGYNCSYPVPEWAADSTRVVKQRPVVSAGQYGSALNQLVFTVDDETGRVVAKSQALLNLKTGQSANYPVDPDTKAIVDQAAADAEAPGSVELGTITDPFLRAKFADGATENRGGESTLNNLVAEVQRWATPESVGGADIAFMNAGGLRDDMIGVGTGEFPRRLTYRQAANVQSFANTLVNMDLTGAQIKTLLEQQWQRAISGDTVSVPARSFIKLGVSDGFTYTYDQAVDPAFPAHKLGTVTGMWLDGEPIDLDETYSVTVNSFLSTGGDNFNVLKQGTGRQDTGKVDLESMVDYMATHAEGVEADYRQRAVGVHFADDAPETYTPGGRVAFDLSSLSMSGSLNAQTLKDPVDDEVEVRLGGEPLGRFDVTTTLTSSGSSTSGLNDDAGTASVEVTLPTGLDAGPAELTVVGLTTGTVARVPIEVRKATATVNAGDVSITWGQAATVRVDVGVPGATGTVQLRRGGAAFGDPATVVNGVASVPLPAGSLEPGSHSLTAVYSGDGRTSPGEDAFTVTVGKAAATVSAPDASLTYGEAETVRITVAPAAATGTVDVLDGQVVVGSATVSGGVARVRLPAKSVDPGASTLSVVYSGDARHASASSTFRLTVAKARSTTTATVVPGAVKVRKGRATVRIDVDGANRVVATGTVTVRVPDQGAQRVRLTEGEARLRLDRFTQVGTVTIRVEYDGSDLLRGSSDRATLRVRR